MKRRERAVERPGPTQKPTPPIDRLGARNGRPHGDPVSLDAQANHPRNRVQTAAERIRPTWTTARPLASLGA